MQKVMEKVLTRKTLYAFCFLWFCVIDQRIMTAYVNSGLIESFRNSMGIAIALIIMSHYKKDDVLRCKKCHLSWLIIGTALCGIVYAIGIPRVLFVNGWTVLMLAIWLWGFVLIQVLGTAFALKRRPKFHKFFSICWLLMMILMCVSRNELLWPYAYLVMFGTFYLVDYSKEEFAELLDGGTLGVIWAFFCFQIHAFLYRPFDSVRYLGFYTNGNNNALFYLFVLAAVIYKLNNSIRYQHNKWWRLFWYLGVGTILSFVFMTIGRGAWLVACVLVLLFLSQGARQKVIKSWFISGVTLVLAFCITFPICFGLVRYVPPLRHHPIWFDGEYSENKIHSWDPWDSEKYTDMDELLNIAFGRILKSLEDVAGASPLLLKVYAQERFEPAISVEEGQNGYVVRKTIYEYFFNNLNIWGHKEKEIGFQLHEGYWVGHAHNIYLQIGTQFGVIAMAAFAVLIVGQLCLWLKQGEKQPFVVLLWLTIPMLFGMVEYCWGAGSLSMTLLFIVSRSGIVRGNDKCIDV